MEVMEDGNLMDKVIILIQRDLDYYNEKQAILQEVICPAVVGGLLDFPRFVSFASMKLVLWWEEEYVAAYRKSSGFIRKISRNTEDDLETIGDCEVVVKDSDPKRFVQAISNSAKNLLDHLHVVTQEALDHADLTVLTGTIGAASLLKNCLWFYIQSTDNTTKDLTGILQETFKKYQEMEEALAERLLDLHCRLVTLYILQDADCLDWENTSPFFEMERGSYVIQMWWLYMKGTREDLWNTVPPNMAKRVFVGILNESLTILTVRYVQATPSEHRTKLLIADLSNLLLCVAQLLPSVCDSAEEYMGISLNNKSKILRDIHSKCQELLYCLILKGAPLDILKRLFRKGIEKIDLLKCKTSGPLPWICFSLPHLFKQIPKNVLKLTEFPGNVEITLELMVLLAQPQPHWSLLLKVLGLKDCRLLKILVELCSSECKEEMKVGSSKKEICSGFLCIRDGQCEKEALSSSFQLYNLFRATTDVILTIGSSKEILKVFLEPICQKNDWAKCLDRRNVWNQIKPAWFLSIMDLARPILPKTIKTTIDAIKTGASMYQAMAIILVCFSYFWDCLDSTLFKVTNMIQDVVPSDITPLSNSVLLQTLISALYSELVQMSQEKKHIKIAGHPNEETATFDGTNSSENEIALALAEALCSIDEDNKHTDQIDQFMEEAKSSVEMSEFEEKGSARVACTQMCDNLVGNMLTNQHGKKNLKVLYDFIRSNSDWVYQQLSTGGQKSGLKPDKVSPPAESLLFTMFHIGAKPFDEVLSGNWRPDWMSLLQTPMGLCTEKMSTHINRRWEFRDIKSSSLTAQDIQAINNISSSLKSGQ
ncbi:uncharacterized protein LOC123320001 [Coccinella septempunctata]|uniref:uncharacterized protein LOC123320001 n=1 Tax=Coccinella septempunctata TaxID=41139 RepID=UPI001D06FBF5|nr:uncharacterized protein LOC123320001 [Coccinella septempunctata]